MKEASNVRNFDFFFISRFENQHFLLNYKNIYILRLYILFCKRDEKPLAVKSSHNLKRERKKLKKYGLNNIELNLSLFLCIVQDTC